MIPFGRARAIVFGIALATYILSYFHRTAPAAIAGELTRAFAISSTVLGTLAGTYFYVYTVLQVPVGVLADTVGPRRLISLGALVAAAGSFLFALAPIWEIAAVGRTLVGIGVSVAFISVLKIAAVWFPPQRFATVTGSTLFAGNLGAVVAAAPLAWLVTHFSWRTVFVALGLVSAALGVAAWIRIRDQPGELGYPAVNPAVPTSQRLPWVQALRHVSVNPSTWPSFMVNVGIGGSFLAFAGLWGVPYLQNVHGMTSVQAAQHTTLLLFGVAVGALAIGIISDRLHSRRGVLRVAVIGYALSWLPWLLGVRWPFAATLAWFFLMGLLIPGFTLSWTIAKETNPPQYSGIATSIVNVGIFLGTGILQPLVGSVLDAGRGTEAAWSNAIAVLAGFAAVGAVSALLLRAPATAKAAAC